MSLKHRVSPNLLQDYFRVLPKPLDLWESQNPQSSPGFFHFGPDIVCYGRSASGNSPDFQAAAGFDASQGTQVTDSGIRLSFDFPSVIENLRTERYVKELSNGNKGGITRNPLVRKAYYGVRELLPVAVRRHFQKAYFKNWRKIPFPAWPVDFTVDLLHQEFLKIAMKSQGVSQVPFIWFWPDGATACTILTHDVETAVGRDFSPTLMDLDQAHGFRASFQVVPEKRYEVPESYCNEIRGRGFEFNIHDLNHDGQLFQERAEFERRAKLINAYAKKFGAIGFRAGAMYRNPEWFGAFEFSYDMSVPNVAHLEPQRGGCCTVMPYFVGNILEIPLTTSQDYSLFNILEDFSIELWKKQISLILQRNGLISCLSHPDYLIAQKPRAIYESLLSYLRQVCDSEHVWHALPGELNHWWRVRNGMNLKETNEGWRITGPESQRARLAYATLDGDRLVYSLPTP